MNGRNPIDIVFLLPLEGPSRNLESLADRRIPINSPRVYQRSAMVGERTEGIAKQLQDPGNPALMFPDRRRPKGESTACDVPAFLDRDLALHSSQVGQAADLLLVGAGQAGAGAKSDVAGGTVVTIADPNFFLQLFERHKPT